MTKYWVTIVHYEYDVLRLKFEVFASTLQKAHDAANAIVNHDYRSYRIDTINHVVYPVAEEE